MWRDPGTHLDKWGSGDAPDGDPGTHLDKLLLIRMLRIYVGFRKGLGLIFVAENGL